MTAGRTKSRTDSDQTFDLISFGAHPDDVEVGSGGVLCKLSNAGHRVGLVILTEGEMGTGGTPAVRHREAKEAAQIMGAKLIKRFDWGDTKLIDTYERRVAIANLIRKHKPRVILAPHWDGFTGRRQSHPDHLATGRIVINAANLATLAKLQASDEPHRVVGIYHYFLPSGVSPSFVVDITSEYDQWIAALSAHKSQFLNPKKSRNYLWSLETMVRGYGARIGVKYGQGFLSVEPLRVNNPLDLVPTRK